MNLNPEVLKKVVVEGLAEEGVVLPMPLPEPSELRLVGSRALLKSIQLVSLLVGIEQRLHERFGLDISLMDEQAMSQTRSPFRNVESLVQYLQKVTGDRNLEIGSR
jgi:acyl carrier protein